MICIHHSKDADGWSSGAIVKYRYPEAKLIGYDYGEEIPWNDIPYDEEVIMVDISFPMNDMIELLKRSNYQLTWIDHHASAKREFDSYSNEIKNKINYVYQLGIAACELTWMHLFPDNDIPISIELLGKYDTWRNGNKDEWENIILPYQYYFRTICSSPEEVPVDVFLYNLLTSILDKIEIGKYILSYQRKQDEIDATKYSFESSFLGYRGLFINKGAFSSNTLQSVYDPDKHDIMIGFSYDGNIWRCSLRSDKPDIDVSEIAKSFGGGGHKSAAGFEVKNLESII